MKKLAIILFAQLLIFATSCKEDEDVAPSNTSLLTGPTWKTAGLRVDPGIQMPDGTIITDLYTQDECFQDDIIKFNTDKTYMDDDGANKCDDVQTETGTWTFNPDETVLTQTSGNTSISYNIKELTKTDLKLTYSIDLFGNGTIYTLYLDMKAK